MEIAVMAAEGMVSGQVDRQDARENESKDIV